MNDERNNSLTTHRQPCHSRRVTSDKHKPVRYPESLPMFANTDTDWMDGVSEDVVAQFADEDARAYARRKIRRLREIQLSYTALGHGHDHPEVALADREIAQCCERWDVPAAELTVAQQIDYLAHRLLDNCDYQLEIAESNGLSADEQMQLRECRSRYRSYLEKLKAGQL